MKINVAKSAGFCFGVKRALRLQGKLQQSGTEVEMLGDIVHNEEVVEDMENTGIKKVQRLRNGTDKTLLIRAHGASADVYNRAAREGLYHSGRNLSLWSKKFTI